MKRSFFLIAFLMAVIASAQETTLAWESAVAVNYSFGEWGFNTSVGHRTLRQKTADDTSSKVAFFDINQFVSRRVSPNLAVAMGYKYRRIDPLDHMGIIEQRLTQQLAYTHLQDRIRLLSRFRAEQRFFTNFFEHRYRYRLSMDMPLSGLKIDIKEFYLLVSNEVLVAIIDQDSRFDNRFNVGVGYLASPLFRIQLEVTQRSEDLLDSSRQIPFVTSSAIFKL